MSIFKKIQTPLLAFIFMALLGLLFGWIWLMVENRGAELKLQVQTIADQEAATEHFMKLITTVENTATDRGKLEEFILQDDSDTITLLSRFDQIASEQQVEIGTSQLVVEETKGDFNKLKLSYQIEGKETRVLKMLKMFETLPYHGVVTAVNISKEVSENNNDSSMVATISLELTIKKYD